MLFRRVNRLFFGCLYSLDPKVIALAIACGPARDGIAVKTLSFDPFPQWRATKYGLDNDARVSRSSLYWSRGLVTSLQDQLNFINASQSIVMLSVCDSSLRNHRDHDPIYQCAFLNSARKLLKGYERTFHPPKCPCKSCPCRCLEICSLKKSMSSHRNECSLPTGFSRCTTSCS